MKRAFLFKRSGADVSLVVHFGFVGVECMIKVVVMLMKGLEQLLIFGVGIGSDITAGIPKGIFDNKLFLLHES